MEAIDSRREAAWWVSRIALVSWLVGFATGIAVGVAL